MVKVVIQDLPDEPPSLTASQFSATLCEDAIGGEVVELVSNCLLLMYLPCTLLLCGAETLMISVFT